MTPIKAGTYGKGHAELNRAMRTCQNFTTSGALRGERWEVPEVSYWDLGDLNRDEAKRFLTDHDDGIIYVVRSYDTPIAWVKRDGSVYRVSQKFSPTTSKHLGATYCLADDYIPAKLRKHP